MATIVELLCPECGDTWLDEGEYVEDLQDVERYCFDIDCGYYGLPEKHTITQAQIDAFIELISRVSQKIQINQRLREEAFQ